MDGVTVNAEGEGRDVGACSQRKRGHTHKERERDGSRDCTLLCQQGLICKQQELSLDDLSISWFIEKYQGALVIKNPPVV